MDEQVAAALELLESFLNTVDVEDGTDALADPASARCWFADRGLLPDGAVVDGAEVDAARELRTALRELALAHHDGQPAGPAAERFSAIARCLPLRAAADVDGHVLLVPAGGGLPGATARIAGALVEASLSGDWPRVKICPADDCAWAFVDRSKNQSRRWCAMGVCGNRQKTRSYRARQREDP